MIESVENIEIAYAKALMVDFDQLKQEQDALDTVAATISSMRLTRPTSVRLFANPACVKAFPILENGDWQLFSS